MLLINVMQILLLRYSLDATILLLVFMHYSSASSVISKKSAWIPSATTRASN